MIASPETTERARRILEGHWPEVFEIAVRQVDHASPDDNPLLLRLAAALIVTGADQERRVIELLEANNREVERRRAAERDIAGMRSGYHGPYAWLICPRNLDEEHRTIEDDPSDSDLDLSVPLYALFKPPAVPE